MKKHPVDDLFKRKLTDLEKEPSANAWARIQEKQQPKRLVLGWMRYVAASIVVGMLGGYLVWQNDRLTVDKPVINRLVAVKPQQTDEVLPDKSIANVAADDPQIALKPKKKLSEEVLPAVLNSRKTQKMQPDAQETSTGNKDLELAKLETEQPREEQFQNDSPLTPRMSEPGNLKSAMPQIGTPSIASLEAEPTRTIVVAVESESDNEEYRPKVSKFSKVFRQLKNARAGERVDWDEVGFNPKTLVARVDDRLRNKEEKTEKYQNPRTKL
ncbi:hypothetical protein [Dyadobacter crusticola]|uniref:hypothetical protein n=1 Tax=Dyadobacter crusticola TaxID=292407 RepID=UPI0004E1ED42|nr:hypothetical protein [Dyadobacter crusticola]